MRGIVTRAAAAFSCKAELARRSGYGAKRCARTANLTKILRPNCDRTVLVSRVSKRVPVLGDAGRSWQRRDPNSALGFERYRQMWRADRLRCGLFLSILTLALVCGSSLF